jgi:hypothetical protein
MCILLNRIKCGEGIGVGQAAEIEGRELDVHIRICEDNACTAGVLDCEFCFPVLACNATCRERLRTHFRGEINMEKSPLARDM